MSSEDILSQSTFSMLEDKIDGRILAAIKLMGLEKPTRIQAESLPHLLMGKDIIGAAKTGSGKTLAFLIPVIDSLIKFGFTRKHGVGCIVLSPTRELALQTFEVLKKLLTDIDLSYTLIVGGEKKQKDIVALRKGVNIIVSTPGRLLDHLENTQNFNCCNLKCLVVDEADKLLEAGFEKHITGIVKLLPSQRQTVLFSATIDSKVENLARLTSKSNPTVVSTNTEKQSTVSGLQQGQYIDGSMLGCNAGPAATAVYPHSYTRRNALIEMLCAVAAAAAVVQPYIHIVTSLEEVIWELQKYCICPVEKRIPWLYKMLKKGKDLKVMVFFSSCKSVDFHYEFFKLHCQASVKSIHGRKSQAKRKEAYLSFVEAQSGILFCTDIAARGLDIPSVDWIVQYDPPTDPKEYIHRVGRTARGLNNKGSAVLLLRPEEELFVNFLKAEKVFLDKYSFGDPATEVQDMLEDLVTNNGVMKLLARKAYLSFLRCYKSHPMKHIFNIKTLDLELTAKGFGFLEQPHVDFQTTSKPKKKRRNQNQQGTKCVVNWPNAIDKLG